MHFPEYALQIICAFILLLAVIGFLFGCALTITLAHPDVGKPLWDNLSVACVVIDYSLCTHEIDRRNKNPNCHHSHDRMVLQWNKSTDWFCLLAWNKVAGQSVQLSVSVYYQALSMSSVMFEWFCIWLNVAQRLISLASWEVGLIST